MAANYRYWCGECGYRTSWLSESHGAAQQEAHYTRRHPAIISGGRVEVRGKRRDGGGCLGLVGALFLVLLLASTCQHQSRSTSMPTSCGSSLTVPCTGERLPANHNKEKV
jgi:hypothetical protein